ncbi:MAG: hypothetical protein QGG40_09420, partial [Myxococcota bacterium]|nr:hypothetical protein [Myxococcota bacterium]
PEVTLKVAVERGGQTSRLRLDQSCVEGDRLYFRVSTSAPAHVVLVRVDALGAEILHGQRLDGGEQDLGLEGPLAWQVEAHESDAVFAVLASPEPLNPEDVEGALGATYNSATATCGSATSLGARCDEVAVRISP